MPCRALKPEELPEILEHIVKLEHKCLFIMGCYTGFRISELLSLTVQDMLSGNSKVPISPSSGNLKAAITVNRRNMKGKSRSRSVPMHPAVRAVLIEYLPYAKGRAKLFALTRQHAHLVITQAARAAGLEGISTHSMRKFFGQRVYELTGKNLIAAQRALGHQSLSSTSYYLDVGRDLVDAAILSE